MSRLSRRFSPVSPLPQVCAFVREVVQGNAVVVGNSLGGFTALAAASYSPNNIKVIYSCITTLHVPYRNPLSLGKIKGNLKHFTCTCESPNFNPPRRSIEAHPSAFGVPEAVMYPHYSCAPLDCAGFPHVHVMLQLLVIRAAASAHCYRAA